MNRKRETFWSEDLRELCESLQSSPAGLTSSDAMDRLRRFGPNLIEAQRETTWWRAIWSQVRTHVRLHGDISIEPIERHVEHRAAPDILLWSTRVAAGFISGADRIGEASLLPPLTGTPLLAHIDGIRRAASHDNSRQGMALMLTTRAQLGVRHWHANCNCRLHSGQYSRSRRVTCASSIRRGIQSAHSAECPRSNVGYQAGTS